MCSQGRFDCVRDGRVTAYVACTWYPRQIGTNGSRSGNQGTFYHIRAVQGQAMLTLTAFNVMVAIAFCRLMLIDDEDDWLLESKSFEVTKPDTRLGRVAARGRSWNEAMHPTGQSGNEAMHPIGRSGNEAMHPIGRSENEAMHPIGRSGNETMHPIGRSGNEAMHPIGRSGNETMHPIGRTDICKVSYSSLHHCIFF